MIRGSSDQLIKKYSGIVLYQHTIAKFLGFWRFLFGPKNIEISSKKPIEMSAKLVPTKEKTYFETSSWLHKKKRKVGISLARHVTLVSKRGFKIFFCLVGTSLAHIFRLTKDVLVISAFFLTRNFNIFGGGAN